MNTFTSILIGWLLFVTLVYLHMFYDIHRDKFIRLRDALTEEE